VDESEEDQVLYESEEFTERYKMEREKTDSITTDDLQFTSARRGGLPDDVAALAHRPAPQHTHGRGQPAENRIIALATSKDEEVENPARTDPSHWYCGAGARVLRTPDGTIRLLVQGLSVSA